METKEDRTIATAQHGTIKKIDNNITGTIIVTANSLDNAPTDEDPLMIRMGINVIR